MTRAISQVIVKDNVGYYTITEQRVAKVSIPRLPWGADVLDEQSRQESAPDPRITMCNRAPRKSIENAYTKIVRAIDEVSREE